MHLGATNLYRKSQKTSNVAASHHLFCMYFLSTFMLLEFGTLTCIRVLKRVVYTMSYGVKHSDLKAEHFDFLMNLLCTFLEKDFVSQPQFFIWKIKVIQVTWSNTWES